MNKIGLISATALIFSMIYACTGPEKWNISNNEKKENVLVIDDFEGDINQSCWDGTVSVSREYPSHRNKSGKLYSDEGKSNRIESRKLPENWSSYEFLKFDVYNPSEKLYYGTIQIFDSQGSDEDAEFHGQSYNGEGKLFLNTGWNHFEFLIQNAMVEEGNRPLDLERIRKLRFSFSDADTSLFIDNIRLVSGNETSGTRSLVRPEDCIVTIDNRNVYTTLAGPPDAIRTGRKTVRLREQAAKSAEELRNSVRIAEMQGFQTLYQRIPLITADIGTGVRSKLVWFQNEKEERKILEHIISSCNEATDEITSMISSQRNSLAANEPENEVSSASLYVPPYPPLNEIVPVDGYYHDKSGKPVIIFSMLQINSGPLLDYFAPFDHRLESYTVGGGSRYNIENSPVYEAFHKYPGTHRVGWDGWCGHLIKDRWAMGGKKEDVVICLESPEIREAVLEYMKIHSREWKNNPNLLYNIMAYELQYICYCDKSQQMFRDWLKKKYGTVKKLNSIWRTSYMSFSEIKAPETHNARPSDDVNRAAWYDWACFNSRRFTDYLKWIKYEMRKLETKVPICAGGTSSMLSSSNSVTGIDEEMIINEVDDVILNESGSSTIFSDLLLSLSDSKKVMVEPEMGGGTHNLLLQFLHGKSDISKWWWGGYPSREYMHMNQTSLPHSKEIALADIEEVLKTGLDVRRLAGEIAEFTKNDPEIAIFYSKTNIIQVSPGLIQAGETPYIDAIYSVWEGARFLGCRIGFVSEKQIMEKKLQKFRLLIIPAAKYMIPEVVSEIKEYITNGGTVVMIPESFTFDQYSEQANRIPEFGITIQGVTLPAVLDEADKKQNYDQSFSQEIIYKDENRSITTLDKDIFSGSKMIRNLTTDGLVQTIDPGINEVLAQFDDGKPAILLVRYGNGSIYYLAAPLKSADYHLLLAPIVQKIGIQRHIVAVDSAGNLITGAEVRSIERRNDYLVYASNLTPGKIDFDLKGRNPIGGVSDLRTLARIPDNHIILNPFQETIFKIDKAN